VAVQQPNVGVDWSGMLVAEHLVASTRARVRTLLLPEHARWLWEHLRRKLPGAFACVLMPDHVHVVAPPGAQPILVRVLAGFTARFRVRFDVLPPQPANSMEIAHRAVRYVLLNPVNEGLVGDPWMWRWSTLRDLGGAAYPVWTPVARLAEALAIQRSWLVHRVTNSTDHKSVAPRASEPIVASIAALCEAVGAALRMTDAEVRADLLARRLVVQAAHAIGMPSLTALARELGCSPRTVRRDRDQHLDALDAVLLCLGDARLRSNDDQEPANSRGAGAQTRRG
jgi:hypothetical protein